MPKHAPIDPLRARLLEYCQEIDERTTNLRDYAANPGNAWLAKGELQTLTMLLTEVETLLEDIKQADIDEGY